MTTCYYDTRGYDNATMGGFSIQDEMCVNYIHYYPATELEVCKSSVSEKTLTEYFDYMKMWVSFKYRNLILVLIELHSFVLGKNIKTLTIEKVALATTNL